MPEPQEAGSWFKTTNRLRFSDNDVNGHLNNAVYATLFEAGRVELLAAAGMLARDRSVSPVLARLEIDFKHELSWPGDVLVETAVQRVGTKSVSFRQRLSSEGTLAAEASTVLVMIDVATRRSVPLADATREQLARWLLPDTAIQAT